MEEGAFIGHWCLGLCWSLRLGQWGLYASSFFFASSGTSSLVEPTSLISTVVVRLMSMSLLLKLILPWTLNSYLESTPSFVQNLTVPLAFSTCGPCPPWAPWPPRPPKLINCLAPSSVRSPV